MKNKKTSPTKQKPSKIANAKLGNKGQKQQKYYLSSIKLEDVDITLK